MQRPIQPVNINSEHTFGVSRASEDWPYHLSVKPIVGCAVDRRLGFLLIKDRRDKLQVPSETVEDSESLEAACARGCLQEMGARVRVIHTLGSVTEQTLPVNYRNQQYLASKTSLYYLCVLESSTGEGEFPTEFVPASEFQRGNDHTEVGSLQDWGKLVLASRHLTTAASF